MRDIEEGYDEDEERTIINEDPMQNEEPKQDNKGTAWNDLLMSHYGKTYVYY